MKKYLKTFIKISFVIGLLYFLGKKGFISIHDTERAFREWRETLPAMAAMTLSTFLGILRWQILLKAQDIHLPFLRTLQLNMVGNFFNIALPGAVSGDFVKAFYIGKEIPGKRARAFGSILFDRVAGLSALVMLSATAFAMGAKSFPALRFFVLLAALTVATFYGYLFLVRETHDPLLRFLRWLESRSLKFSSVTRVYEGLRHYQNHRIAVFFVLLISITVHMMVGWACLQFAQALGDSQLTLNSIYVIVPLGLLVTAVPVAPAGIGTGHTAFMYLFGLLGSSVGANVFTLFALVQIFFGAIGGVIYLQFRTREAAPDFSQATTSIDRA